jgi:hypothetical protein
LTAFLLTVILLIAACAAPAPAPVAKTPEVDIDTNGNGWYDVTAINVETGTFFDAEGYDKEGFDAKGWNRQNINKGTYSLYDADGYNRTGFDAQGYDKDGYDADGWNASKTIHKSTKTEYGADGYNKDGWNAQNKHKDTGTLYAPGADAVSQYDRSGYNIYGFNASGLNWRGEKDIEARLTGVKSYDVGGARLKAAIMRKLSDLNYAVDEVCIVTGMYDKDGKLLNMKENTGFEFNVSAVLRYNSLYSRVLISCTADNRSFKYATSDDAWKNGNYPGQSAFVQTAYKYSYIVEDATIENVEFCGDAKVEAFAENYEKAYNSHYASPSVHNGNVVRNMKLFYAMRISDGNIVVDSERSEESYQAVYHHAFPESVLFLSTTNTQDFYSNALQAMIFGKLTYYRYQGEPTYPIGPANPDDETTVGTLPG